MDEVFCSFIVPAFNAEATLDECLRAIFGQKTDFSYEVIVVDNNSTDATETISSRFPVQYIKEHRQGRSHARNAGICQAKGQFVAFIDSDTIIEEMWLASLVRRIEEHPGIGAVQGRIRLSYLANSPQSLITFSKLDTQLRLLGHSSPRLLITDCDLEKETLHPLVNTAACLYRTSILQEIKGFDPAFGRLEDGDLSERVLRSGYALASCCKTLSFKYETTNWWKYITAKWKDHFYIARFLYLYEDSPSAINYLKAIPRIVRIHWAKRGKEEHWALFTRMLLQVSGYLVRWVATFYFRATLPKGLPCPLKSDPTLPDQPHGRRIYLRNYLMIINLRDRSISLQLGPAVN